MFNFLKKKSTKTTKANQSKKSFRKFNRTTKPNVKKPTVLYNKYSKHHEIVVNKTPRALGSYTAKTSKGKQMYQIENLISKTKTNSNDNKQYVSSRYRRYPKNTFNKSTIQPVSIAPNDFETVRSNHIKKYKYSGKKIKVTKK